MCLMWKTRSTSVPRWISHTWISPGSDPHPPGMWVLGHGHTPGRGLSPKQPRGWFGVCSRVDTQSRLVGHGLSPCSFGQDKALGCGVWIEPDLDTACSLRAEPHLKVLHPSSVAHSLRLALAPTGALLGAGVEQAPHGSAPWQLQPCVPRALCELRLLSPTAPSASGQLQQLHPAWPAWTALSAPAVLSTGPVTAPHGIPSCCWSSLSCPGTGMAWTVLRPHIWPGCSSAVSSRAGQRPAAVQVSHKAKACSWKLRLPHLSPDLSHTTCGSSWSVLGTLVLPPIPKPQTLHRMDRRGGGYCGCSVLQASHGTLISLISSEGTRGHVCLKLIVELSSWWG